VFLASDGRSARAPATREQECQDENDCHSHLGYPRLRG
jgi:hypothetical protein